MIVIRPMEQGDIDGIAAIERQSPSPWSEQQIRAELEKGDSGYSFVAEDRDACLGWCCGHAAGPEAELFKIGVDRGERRQGIGTMIYAVFEKALMADAVETIFLEVRESNASAIQFYRRHGFKEVGRRTRYYRDPVEDGLLFKKSCQ